MRRSYGGDVGSSALSCEVIIVPVLARCPGLDQGKVRYTMNAIPPLNWDLVDRMRYEQALATEGFFSPSEGQLLMRVLQHAGPRCRALEVGSYRGRSALFALAALPPDGRLVGVDAFIDAAGYAGHSALDLASRVGDDRFTVIEGTLAEAWRTVSVAHCDVALVDADHSFAGASADLALTTALLRPGGKLLVHDVASWFPGVTAAVGALVRAGVLAELQRIESLCAYDVVSRPRWLTDPTVDDGEALPSPDDANSTPLSVRLWERR
jgi:predicted O-methyltransferase YrrM